MKVIICECVSNGIFLLDDCRKLGLEPVVVFPPVTEGDSLVTGIREEAMGIIGDSVEVICPASFDELVERLSGEDIACILPGSEYGIVYSDRLCAALGFPGNDPESTYRRTTKFGMHESLREAGLRYIPSRMVSDREGVEAFWKEFSPKRVILKPDVSVGTLGLHVCEDIESAMEAMDAISRIVSWSGGDIGDILIQEMVGGEEYIVNTISRNGVHRITDVWVYTKAEMGGGVAPIGVRTVTEPNERELGLMEYALGVLDAVDLREGPSHIEIKLDEEGPVLIEVNARPMGGHFSVPALDRALGHHITDIVLRAMVEDGFLEGLPEGAPDIGDMHMLVLVLYEGRYVDMRPLSELVINMKSFFNLIATIDGDAPVYVEGTANYVSSIGSVELVHDDGQIMEEDFALLWDTEERMPDLMYGPREPLPPVERRDTMLPEGRVLVLGPEGIRVHDCGFREPYPDERFDRCVMDLYGTMLLSDIYRGLHRVISMLDTGGTITITPQSFDMVPYGWRGMFRIMMLSYLECDVSSCSEPLVATKVA